MKFNTFEQLRPLLLEISILTNRYEAGEISNNERTKLKNKAIREWKKGTK